MKCPKCGYNSFEFYDTCKKCSNDLTSYRELHGLKPIVIPQEARAALASAFAVQAQPADQHVEQVEEENDMFSFDLPDYDDNQASETKDDPFDFINQPAQEPAGFGEFSFDDEQEAAPAASQPAVQEDEFSNLLESTSLDDPFAMPADTPAPPPAPAAADAASPGEFDLNSFSWDEPETASATPAAAAPKPEDDFDSLFGDSVETKK